MKHLLLTILTTIFCVSLFAQENRQDVVHLTNGIVVRGTITEEAENQYIRIRTTDGSFIFPMNDIEKIEKEYFDGSNNFAVDTENIRTNPEDIAPRNIPRAHIPQEIPVRETRNAEHSVFVEFLGSTGGLYNISYDCAFPFAERHKIALGIGLGYSQHAFGSYIQVNYLYGKTHHLEIGTGLAFPEMDFSYDNRDSDSAYPFVRIGYRFQESGGLFFRVAFTPFLSYNRYDQILYIGLWGGVAFGFTF
jgi:hypothetical protein